MATAAKDVVCGEAGRRGPEVRSDCWVRVTPGDDGGVALDLQSRVASLYGDSIRELVAEMLPGLGEPHARVELDDAGALPFVLMARIETAVRRLRAGGIEQAGPAEYLPDWGPNTRYPTTRERFRRSRLYLPGNEPKFMLNAGLHGPDAVILDLEDSVAPAEKDAARVLVRNALRALDFRGAERMVRINQGTAGLEDLEYCVPHNLHLVLIPKVEDAAQVREVDERIGEILSSVGPPCPTAERRSDEATKRRSGKETKRRRDEETERQSESKTQNPKSKILLMPIVESALGALRAYEIATASPNVVGLAIGLEDYTADIGAQRTAEGRESFWARSQVLNAARAAGVQPIDTVFSDVADEAGLRASVLEARSLGFEGKGCIHPRQIRVIHEAFAPSPAELERARAIVAAFEEAEAKGLGVVSLGSKMIDPPVVKRAQRIVRLAEAMEAG